MSTAAEFAVAFVTSTETQTVALQCALWGASLAIIALWRKL